MVFLSNNIIDILPEEHASSASGRYQEAIDYYDEAINLNPEDAEAYAERGDVYFNFGHYQQALSSYNKSLQFNPQNAEAHYNRGLIHAELGNHERAIQDYNYTISRDLEFVLAYTNRGISYARLGNYKQAIDDYSEAIKLNSKDTLAYVNRWIAYRKIGDNDLADQDYSKLFEINSEHAEVLVHRALAYEKYGSYRKVLIIEKMKDVVIDEDALAEGAYMQAIKDYSKLIKLSFNNALAYFKRGLTYQKLRQYGLALRDYDKAIEIDPQNVDAHNKRNFLITEKLDIINELYDEFITTKSFTKEPVTKEEIGKTIREINGQNFLVSTLAKNLIGMGGFAQSNDFKLILADTCFGGRNIFLKKIIANGDIQKDIHKKFLEVTTLEELKHLIMQLKEVFDDEFWNFRDPRRTAMLYDLVVEFIEYKKRMNIDDDLDAMKHWASRSKLENDERVINERSINNLGITGFQYLRMLCGVDTVKPDTNIMKCVKNALGYEKKPYEVIKLLEIVSEKMKLSMVEIDQMILIYNAPDIKEIFFYKTPINNT